MQQPSRCLLAFFLILLCESAFSALTGSNSLVVSSTESTKEESGNEANQTSQINPEIYSMQIHTNVSNRFATTLITSKVRNIKDKAEEATFAVILPEDAFISEFEMEIKGKIYKAYVKGKEEAKQIYQQAVASGQSAAHVELNARDSKTFTVSVNIEPESKTIFRLTYEELLQRQIGQYELVINIRPGQTVEDLGVQVHINESRPLTFVRTPSLRTGNEIGKNYEKLNPSAEINIIDNTSATVKFNPDVSEQKKFAENLGGEKENGLAGQFVVQYDVERDPQGGEVLVRDGYFVHFFAPSDLQPLPKHVVFVLDYSGSMEGRNFEQLVVAMQNILPELKPEDLFHLVRFSNEASVWNEVKNKFITIQPIYEPYGNLEPYLREANLPKASKANKKNIRKAKTAVGDNSDMLSTNMIAGLEVGLFLTKRTQEKFPDKYQPMIIFLTDGFPNIGMSSTDEITKTVTEINSGATRTAIFSMSFGDGADKDFLRKLSSHNLGFSRHIYEASDASLQLHDFYRLISSPLLSNIKFSYVDGVSQVTRTHHPTLFKGSELVVAGRTSDDRIVLHNIVAICPTGPITFNATSTKPVDSLERLWAYLTVKQLLKEKETTTNTTELNKKALDLALKYSFVTSLTSLVVVKPNQTDSIDSAVPDVSSPDREYGATQFPMTTTTQPNTMPTFDYDEMRRELTRASLYPTNYKFRGRRPYPVYYAPAWQPPQIPILSTSTARPDNADTTLPQWLAQLKQNHENVTTAQGTFKLGQKGDAVARPYCHPYDNLGVCTIIFDCPKVFPVLRNLDTYLLYYFCPLNEFAGVCCPVHDRS